MEDGGGGGWAGIVGEVPGAGEWERVGTCCFPSQVFQALSWELGVAEEGRVRKGQAWKRGSSYHSPATTANQKSGSKMELSGGCWKKGRTQI